MNREATFYSLSALFGGSLVVLAFFFETEYLYPMPSRPTGPQGFHLILFFLGAIIGLAVLAYFSPGCRKCGVTIGWMHYLGCEPGRSLLLCAECEHALSHKQAGTKAPAALGEKADRDWSD